MEGPIEKCKENCTSQSNSFHGDNISEYAATTGESSFTRKSLLLDSGASDHMVCAEDWLHDVREIVPRGIVLGDGKRVYAILAGTLVLRTTVSTKSQNQERKFLLRDVLHVPELHTSLISCSRSCDQGYDVNFGRAGCGDMLNGTLMFQGRLVRGAYHFNGTSAVSEIFCQSSASIDDDEYSPDSEAELKLWHQRLGHANIPSIKKLFSSGAVTVKNEPRFPVSSRCDSCVKGKQVRQTPRKNTSRSKQRGEVIHSDICGPMSAESFSRCRYFISFIDEYSGLICTQPIHRKSEALAQFKLFVAWLERKYECHVNRLHSDNGGENVAFKDYLADRGIEHTAAPPYSKNENGIAEQVNRTIVECARTLLSHAGLPKAIWAEAVVHAAKMRNHFTSPRDSSRTPLEIMNGIKPDISYFRAFGSLRWYHVPKELRRKLDEKSQLGVLIGCFPSSQYKLWIPSRCVAVVTRDVTVIDNRFPFRRSVRDFNGLRESHEEDEELVHSGDDEMHQSNGETRYAEMATGAHEHTPESETDLSQLGRELLESGESILEHVPLPESDSHGSSNLAKCLSTLSAILPDPLTVEKALSQSDSHQW